MTIIQSTKAGVDNAVSNKYTLHHQYRCNFYINRIASTHVLKKRTIHDYFTLYYTFSTIFHGVKVSKMCCSCSITPKSLCTMQNLKGVLVSLSILANSKIDFNYPGTCPVPSSPSVIFEDIPGSTDNFYTVYLWSTDKEIYKRFEERNELTCIQLIMEMEMTSFGLQDCAFYKVNLNRTESGSYDFLMVNEDPMSNGFKQSSLVTGIYIWADERNETIIFWTCVNNYNSTSHHQVALQFVNFKMIRKFHIGFLYQFYTDLRWFLTNSLQFTKVDEKYLNQCIENTDILITTNCRFTNCSIDEPLPLPNIIQEHRLWLWILILTFGTLVLFIALVKMHFRNFRNVNRISVIPSSLNIH